MKFYFSNILIGVFLFISNLIAWLGAFQFYGSQEQIDNPLNPWVLGFAWMNLALIWPVIGYVMFFSRPHNPLSKPDKQV